jgi:hypothetical protein
VSKLVAPACCGSSLGSNPDISQKYKMGDISNGVANTLKAAKKIKKFKSFPATQGEERLKEREEGGAVPLCQVRGKELGPNKTTEQNVILWKPRSRVLLRLNIKTLLMYSSYLKEIVVLRMAIKNSKKFLLTRKERFNKDIVALFRCFVFIFLSSLHFAFFHSCHLATQHSNLPTPPHPTST